MNREELDVIREIVEESIEACGIILIEEEQE